MTKTEIKKMRKALNVIAEAEDYDLVMWGVGEVESLLNKMEAKLCLK